MVQLDLYGVACRVLLLTAASFSTWNRVTLEFSTPEDQDVNSMLMCVNDTNFVLNEVLIDSLLVGGDLFAGGNATDIFTSGGAVRNNQPSTFNAPAFFRTVLPLWPLEAPLGIEDVLGTDTFYSSTYSNVRCVQLVLDCMHVLCPESSWNIHVARHANFFGQICAHGCMSAKRQLSHMHACAWMPTFEQLATQH